MIEIHELTKRYGSHTVVDRLSFDCKAGEVLGFLGPNGAGKSTTMKMITGFVTPDSGSARVCGHDVGDEALEARRHLGYLPEGAPCYPEMTPRSFLEFVADVRQLKGDERRRRLDAVIAELHLEPVLDQSVETLSKGFKRRVGLAQAILHDPDVLILDEPTDGLDPNQKHEVRNLIRELGRNKAIVFSTHILEEVDAACTRAIIIDRGRIVANGTPAELRGMSALAGAVTLSARGADEEDLAKLGRVEKLNGTLRIYPQDKAKSAELAQAIIELVNRRGWKVEGMYSERGELDEVFRRITLPDTVGK
jgi:ABC-2 type transport system ATP-binding protein